MAEAKEVKPEQYYDFISCYRFVIEEYGEKVKPLLKEMLIAEYGFVAAYEDISPYILEHPDYGTVSLITLNDFKIGLQRLGRSMSPAELQSLIESTGDFIFIESEDPTDQCHSVRMVEDFPEMGVNVCETCEDRRRQIAQKAIEATHGKNLRPHLEIINGGGTTSKSNASLSSVLSTHSEKEDTDILTEDEAHAIMYKYMKIMQREHMHGYYREQCHLLASCLVFGEEIPEGVFNDEPELLQAIEVIKYWSLNRRRKIVYELLGDDEMREEQAMFHRREGLKRQIEVELQLGEAREAYKTRRQFDYIEFRKCDDVEIRRMRAYFPKQLYSLLERYGVKWTDDRYNPRQLILDSFTRNYEEDDSLRTIEEDLEQLGYSYKTGEECVVVDIEGFSFLIHSRVKHRESKKDATLDFNLKKIERMLPKNPRVLYVGSSCDQRIRDIFSDAAYLDISMDLLEEGSIKGDAYSMPFKAEAFDLVICKSLDGRVLFSSDFHDEVGRVLNTNGYFFNSNTANDGDITGQRVLMYHKLELDGLFRAKGFVAKGETRLKKHTINSLLRKTRGSC